MKGRPFETCARVYEKKEKGWKETEIELLKIILYCRERGRECYIKSEKGNKKRKERKERRIKRTGEERDSENNKEIIRNLE